MRGSRWIEERQGTCPCNNRTSHQCTCGDFWCPACLNQHTSAPGGRCPKAIELEQKKGEG